MTRSIRIPYEYTALGVRKGARRHGDWTCRDFLHAEVAEADAADAPVHDVSRHWSLDHPDGRARMFGGRLHLPVRLTGAGDAALHVGAGQEYDAWVDRTMSAPAGSLRHWTPFSLSLATAGRATTIDKAAFAPRDRPVLAPRWTDRAEREAATAAEVRELLVVEDRLYTSRWRLVAARNQGQGFDAFHATFADCLDVGSVAKGSAMHVGLDDRAGIVAGPLADTERSLPSSALAFPTLEATLAWTMAQCLRAVFTRMHAVPILGSGDFSAADGDPELEEATFGVRRAMRAFRTDLRLGPNPPSVVAAAVASLEDFAAVAGPLVEIEGRQRERDMGLLFEAIRSVSTLHRRGIEPEALPWTP